MTLSPRRRSQRKSESGAASLELLVLIPLLFTFALIAFQVGVTAWTASSTAEAVREAARAASLGYDAGDAARAALPERLRGGASLAPNGRDRYGFRLTVQVPSVSGLPAYTVTRSAVMP